MNIKLILLLIALTITAGTFYYTQHLVKELQKSERQIVELYANSLRFISTTNNTNSEDHTFVFENIIKRINFPLILTDSKDKPIGNQIGRGIKNIDIDSNLTQDELQLFLKEKIKELGNEHQPIDVTYEDSIFLGRIYYGNSDIIKRLKYYPFLQVLFAFFFVTIAYISFSYIKKTEQSNIWVGMAKEIAHQLGTPISSLMGWTELLKLKYKKPDEVKNVANEMESDLTRLNKITNRFSKIGSRPSLKKHNVVEVISTVISYFEKRLPQTGKNVKLLFDHKNPVYINLNAELFEWVIENLIKNAIDAIGRKNGEIKISINDSENSIEIKVEDNGKGISTKNKKNIFKPGYSTKNRGWGLGLSLSKRIIEDYHKGKLILLNSIQDEGTTFGIYLNKKG